MIIPINLGFIQSLRAFQIKIHTLIESKKKLDSQIESYKIELSKIDSTIAKVKNQKITIKEYYKEKGEEIDKMTKSQIDSLLHKRYNY